MTDDGKYLVLEIDRSTDPQNQVLVREASAPADAPFKELIGDFDNEFSFVGNEGTKFYFLTDLARADEADRGDGHRPSRAAST